MAYLQGNFGGSNRRKYFHNHAKRLKMQFTQFRSRYYQQYLCSSDRSAKTRLYRKNRSRKIATATHPNKVHVVVVIGLTGIMHYCIVHTQSARLCAINEQIQNFCFRCENIQDKRIFSDWDVSKQVQKRTNCKIISSYSN